MPNGTPAQAPSVFPTYRLRPVDGELEQGDILTKTPDVLQIIREVHPHYLKSDYTHFLVLTQSCDLIRRKSTGCKSRYITLAAIRPLDLVVSREIEEHQDKFDKAANVCSDRHRFRLKQLVERIFNYNEHEYFYLHPEAIGTFTDPSCAFLRLSVAIKTDHYDVCQRSRILSLSSLYQAKLGWMVGNMYSRVGTDDWVGSVESQAEFDNRLKILLDKTYTWVSDKQLAAAKKSRPEDLLQQGQEAVLRHISQTRVQDLTDEVIKAVLAQLRKLGIGTEEAQASKIQAALANDGVLAKVRKLQTPDQ